MIIEPKVRGFICTTAHPVGCAAEVARQVREVRAGAAPAGGGPSRVLVVGASMGYGLASRLAAAFGWGAASLGVQLERPAKGKRTATAGWYNTAAFHRQAEAAGLWAGSVNGDAFSTEVKAEACGRIREGMGGPVDLVVYSLAAPRRKMPDDRLVSSALKPIGAPFHNKNLDTQTGEVTTVEIQPAAPEEIDDTVTVMGGEDWAAWIDALEQEGLLAPGATTLAYSYLGPELTYPIYRDGTIGRAKDHLEATAHRLNERLGATGGRAFVSVNKAVVTQSSSAIPVVPLYISILFSVMKARACHEGTIEQMDRLLRTRIYAGGDVPVDERGRIRMDDWEMASEIQQEVARRWAAIDTASVSELADVDGYRSDFLRLFGFGVEGVDEAADVDPEVDLGGE